MKTINVRNIEIGKGRPKICVSIMGNTIQDLNKELEGLQGLPFDIIEWRMDYFNDILIQDKALKAVQFVRQTLKEIPLLATFRTAKEGGEITISVEEYVQLNRWMIDSHMIDLIDIECFTGDEVVKTIVNQAHANGVYVIMSNHDFNQTPSYDEIIARLCLMQDMNADIPKIALMPQSKKDVLTVLQATLDMYEQYADRPIITISMGQNGVISRLSGELFGSCLTFGAAKVASAPGQIDVKNLDTILEIFHKSLYIF